MVVGVTDGFEKVLEVNGVGYRAELQGKNLVLNVGYSHPVEIEPPDGIVFDVDPRARQIKVQGYDKAAVGQVAANIRKVRPPEPYKGKGIKYIDERIRRKAGKAGKLQA
jgi:large subunit ribosomal protein L6